MSLPEHGGKQTAASRPAAGDRRTETRFPENHPATLKLLNPQTSARIPAIIVDSSGGGVKLSVDRDILPGTLVQVRVDGRVLLGEVRFSNPQGNAYLVGVRLQDVFDTNAEA